ncbi:hypothetical protein [Streptomyces sp. B21-105]|uniref:hypothetical protein n=1 Tax=Streptomyces sp. B21-105 TaxID=3039417 RepID=UPI003FA7BDF2
MNDGASGAKARPLRRRVAPAVAGLMLAVAGTASLASCGRLKNVEGRGNATADVSLTGKPRAVVETRFVGADDLAAGARAHPLAISRKPPQPPLTAEVAKAQRY